MHQVGFIYKITKYKLYVQLTVWMQEHMLLHTRLSAIQNNKYQVSQNYSSSS
jgi:hypothetical protein